MKKLSNLSTLAFPNYTLMNSKKRQNLQRLHRFTNFEIQEYYQNEVRFNSVYSRNNLSETKDGGY